MIRLPNDEELATLKAFKEPNCLTLYVSFVDQDAATNPNLITSKNLLKKAELSLIRDLT